MKLTNIKDINKFFEVVNKCKGDVKLVTDEGDVLNLKSTLTQYVSFATIFAVDEVPHLEVVTAEKEDSDLLLNFMIFGGE